MQQTPGEAREPRVETRSWPDGPAFRRAVDRAMDSRPGGPEVLERQLRSRYPAVRVVAQDAAASYVHAPVWYVYRDGQLVGH